MSSLFLPTPLKIWAALLLMAAVMLTEVIGGLQTEWESWKTEHLRRYLDKGEDQQKFSIWKANMDYIEKHNKDAEKHGFVLKMNKFGDMTRNEFFSDYQCVQSIGPEWKDVHSMKSAYGSRASQYKAVNLSLPESIDWRDAGIVTGVKDQLRCGASYAFSTVGALEGMNALGKGSLVKLSEQNVVDCSGPYGNHGCTCGSVINTYLYIIDNGGIDTASSYPYKSKQYYCKFSTSNVGAKATGFVLISSGSESDLMSAVATAGPVAVHVDANSYAFQFYSDGILDVVYCSSTNLSHTVLVVGYGTYKNKDYWLIKNSWGPNWGINGYAMMARNRYNQCGIATAASFPTL
uniref:Silicatein-G1 n=1 Tax=Ephydatia fluviatilis TaxID=31330 RepID=B5U9F3_9METZ|nr:silicatein-G1 [Ephydatia fluviatilis]